VPEGGPRVDPVPGVFPTRRARVPRPFAVVKQGLLRRAATRAEALGLPLEVAAIAGPPGADHG